MSTKRRSAYADKLLAFSDFVFSDGAEFKQRGRWREFFAGRIGAGFNDRVIFEIGCNDAALLVRVAGKWRNAGFVGIDWKYRALHAAAERVSATGLRNVALLHGRAQDVRKIFGDGEIADAWVFHPEPCDKPKELANRLIAKRFLLDLHSTLRDGGALILKTDHAGYYEWSLSQVAELADQLELVCASSDFWNDPAAQADASATEFAGESSAFEDRFRKKHRPIYYLRAKRRGP